MRGIRLLQHRLPRPCRISPAHAGNTARAAASARALADQPCTCGEYLTDPRVDFDDVGSAPHMRGIPRRHQKNEEKARISPAHAGNTWKPGPARPKRADQPRTCGEYTNWLARGSGSPGSAPHMRGIPSIGPQPWAWDGISPAHAGNTPGWSRASAHREDQPRTCGEYYVIDGGDDAAEGSAPHMRGLRSDRRGLSFVTRISPAHAGNTFL